MPSDGDVDDADAFEEYTLLSKACVELEPVITQQFKMFAREYGHMFVDAARGKEEHKAEYAKLHDKFQKRFEVTVTKYLTDHGADEDQFYQECEDSLTGKFCALFEEDINKEFVLRLLAITDYLHFYEVMVRACKGMLSAKESKMASK